MMVDESWLLDERNPQPWRYDEDRYQDEPERPRAGVSRTPAREEAPVVEDRTHGHDTTDNDGRQVSLLVGYEGAFPPPPETYYTGRIVQFILDGKPVQPPADTAQTTRDWLHANGFSPDYVRWQALDRKVPDGELRHRLEVFVGPSEVKPGSWWGAECATPRRDTERLQALARERNGGQERAPDEPFVPESGQGADLRHPYAKLRGW
jgi:hypothetical protein